MRHVTEGLEPTETGLINADVSEYNVVWHRGRPGLVDFNDSGLGPYAFCLGRLVERVRRMENGAALTDELLRGYQEVIPLPVDYQRWGPWFELAASMFRLRLSSACITERGTTLMERDLRILSTARKRLEGLALP